MEPEIIKQEIKNLLERMGFGQELEAIEARQGATNRFGVVLKNRAPGPGEADTKGMFEQEDELDFPPKRRSIANMLIGEQGKNLVALEHILKKIIRKKHGADSRFTLDINDYRIKRLEGLKQDVKNAAKEARMYRREVVLRPMSSFERRVIHMLLAEYPDITTESTGEEPNRRVVIKPYQ